MKLALMNVWSCDYFLASYHIYMCSFSYPLNLWVWGWSGGCIFFGGSTWFIGWFTGWFICWFTGWFICWFIGLNYGWFTLDGGFDEPIPKKSSSKKFCWLAFTGFWGGWLITGWLLDSPKKLSPRSFGFWTEFCGTLPPIFKPRMLKGSSLLYLFGS